jgi:hypothetical protein
MTISSTVVAVNFYNVVVFQQHFALVNQILPALAPLLSTSVNNFGQRCTRASYVLRSFISSTTFCGLIIEGIEYTPVPRHHDMKLLREV